jgi:hypothetical protein
LELVFRKKERKNIKTDGRIKKRRINMRERD